jgi:hypothetical protein
MPIHFELPIDCYGNVHLCCHDWNNTYKIGNVITQSLSQIIQSEEFRNIERSVNAKLLDLALCPAICKQCDAPYVLIPELENKFSKRIVAVSMVKNEADVIEIFCRYTLNFCDLMLILDDNSGDDTPKIINAMINEGLPIVLKENKDTMGHYQDELITQLTADAFLQYGADLVLPLDADEFVTVGDYTYNIKSILNELDEDTEYLAKWRTYVMTDEALKANGNLLERFTKYRDPQMEVFHKTIVSRKIFIEYHYKIAQGNHRLIASPSSPPINTVVLCNLEYAHFPIRSLNQLHVKIINGWLNEICMPERDKPFHWMEMYNTIKNGGSVDQKTAEQLSLYYAMPNAEYATLIKERDALLIEKPVNTLFRTEGIELKYSLCQPNPNTLILSHMEHIIEQYNMKINQFSLAQISVNENNSTLRKIKQYFQRILCDYFVCF